MKTTPICKGEGLIYGITYVDLKTKCVFNGSDLGKVYSAMGIQQRCMHEEKPMQTLKLDYEPAKERSANVSAKVQEIEVRKVSETKEQSSAILDDLLKQNKDDNNLPYQLIKKRKKKRRLHL